MRWAKKRDLSESTIVKALRMIGCDVEQGTDVDLYVKAPDGRSWLIECKTAGNNERRRQPIQKRLQAIFGPQYVVAKDAGEALKAIGYYDDVPRGTMEA